MFEIVFRIKPDKQKNKKNQTKLEGISSFSIVDSSKNIEFQGWLMINN